MKVSEILKVKGNTLYTVPPETCLRCDQSNDRERYRVAGRHE